MDKIRQLGLQIRYDQEYEREWPCTDIFVTGRAIRQLADTADWWRPLPYRTRPNEQYRHLIRVPINTLDRDRHVFDPSLAEPDMILGSQRKLTARQLLDWFDWGRQPARKKTRRRKKRTRTKSS